MDTTGYGRSTRPAAMNDPCNLSAEQQALFVPALIAAPCTPTYPGQLTTIASDWHDIDAVVDYIRALRKVEKVSLVGWSLGGPRAGGYAAQHPEKVQSPGAPGAGLQPRRRRPSRRRCRTPGTVFNTQSRAEFDANWDRQVGCPNQFDPAVRDAVWNEMLASDPVGAKWGSGVRRAPSTTTLGLERGVDRQHEDADHADCRGPRQAGAGRARQGGLCRPGRRPTRCSSTWAAPRTTRCGKLTTC